MKALFESETGKFKFSKSDDQLLLEFENSKGEKDWVRVTYIDSVKLESFISRINSDIEIMIEKRKPTFWQKLISKQ